MKTLKLINNYLLFIFLSSILFSCAVNWGECKDEDPDFRPHKVRHCNKSKTYWYYHNTPCDCPGLRKDLELDSHFGKTYKNYVVFYDNGEIVFGR